MTHIVCNLVVFVRIHLKSLKIPEASYCSYVPENTSSYWIIVLFARNHVKPYLYCMAPSSTKAHCTTTKVHHAGPKLVLPRQRIISPYRLKLRILRWRTKALSPQSPHSTLQAQTPQRFSRVFREVPRRVQKWIKVKTHNLFGRDDTKTVWMRNAKEIGHEMWSEMLPAELYRK